MEKVIVVKDLVYAAGVTAIGDVHDNLANGGVAIFNSETGALLPAVVVDADYLDLKQFIIAFNIEGTTRLTKGIVRRGVVSFIEGLYIAPVFHTVQAGGTNTQLAFDIADADVGDVSIRVADNTFTGQYATAMYNASVYKKASDTVEEVVDELVAKLNANTMLPVIATVIGAAPSFGITIQSQTRGQILSLTGEGLLEGMYRAVDGTESSVLPVNGAGVDEDVLQHEFEVSMYWGNSNSREIAASWYSQETGAVMGETYVTKTFTEKLNKPYIGETNVSPNYTVYIPSGAATLIGVLDGIFAKLIGGAYTEASSSEPGDDV